METIAVRPDNEWASQTDRLIAGLTSTLVHLDADDVGGIVEDALRRIGEEMDVDRCTLVEFSGGDAPADAAFHWARMPLGDHARLDADVELLKALIDRARIDHDVFVLGRIPGGLPVDVLSAIPEERLPQITLTSAVVIRVAVSGTAGTVTCALAAGVISGERSWSDRVVDRLRIVAEILAAALARRRQEQALRQSREEIAQLRARIDHGHGAEPDVEPRTSIAGFEQIVGNSPALRTALGLLQEVASTDSTVLLLGETGTGKELFARALHARSSRRQYSIVSVNCAALPATLIESELFGHERGAFTDAVAQRQGRFELAHRGTLFLDEIGDLPLEVQAKLLRVLQEGEFERVGASHSRKVDVRIVAATHRDLNRAVTDGEFREDLFYRLNVFPIRLPPLRERREDIPALVWCTIHKRQHATHRDIKRVPQAVMDALQSRTWPGNIRELENVVERALIHSSGDTLVLSPDGPEEAAAQASADAISLSSIERAHIEKVLRECGWRINGTGNTAERLGLHPNTLRFRMKKLGIVRARAVEAPPRQPAARSS